MSYFTHDFVGEIGLHGVGKSRVITYKVLFMPPRFETELPFKTYPRLRVEGEIADVPVRGAWMPVGDGRRYFIVSPDIKANTGLDVGDEVEMRFRVDDQDHVDVPDALTAALDADDAASAQWEKLTAGKRRMFTNHVFSAKTSPTEQRRVDEAMAAIKEGITLRDLQKRKA
ncbi:YdeI/OmpD-associated family protein [uncultured Roseobacter sp.]|uniref:YdeI/OmpD-associated family protein n=1 Tax=uncultured Roseobacter sp. TaxID=114847 RepID=UPI00261FD319|nr:YdeI/OmpD-associated family protein [uncultured Roseobacter sp.]